MLVRPSLLIQERSSLAKVSLKVFCNPKSLMTKQDIMGPQRRWTEVYSITIHLRHLVGKSPVWARALALNNMMKTALKSCEDDSGDAIVMVMFTCNSCDRRQQKAQVGLNYKNEPQWNGLDLYRVWNICHILLCKWKVAVQEIVDGQSVMWTIRATWDI